MYKIGLTRFAGAGIFLDIVSEETVTRVWGIHCLSQTGARIIALSGSDEESASSQGVQRDAIDYLRTPLHYGPVGNPKMYLRERRL